MWPLAALRPEHSQPTCQTSQRVLAIECYHKFWNEEMMKRLVMEIAVDGMFYD